MKDKGRAAMKKSMFYFELKPLEQCALSGEQVKNLWWFYLTDSWYAVNTGKAVLFESSQERMKKYPGKPFLDYYYIRFLEDLFDILPQVAVSIPQDLYALVDSEEKRCRLNGLLIDYFERYETEEGDVPEEVEENYLRALSLLHHGILDTGFLRFRSLCRFCRTGDKMTLHYDFRDADEEGVPVWSAGVGQCEMGYGSFLQEIRDMLDRFFDAMDRQIAYAVEAVRKNPGSYMIDGKTRLFCPDEIAACLQKEQLERKRFFYQNMAALRKEEASNLICWEDIRRTIHKIGI